MSDYLVNNYLESALPIGRLAEAPCYVPWDRGRYEVKPGLLKFGTDLGNGVWDQRVFQIDGNFSHYHHMKQLARRERLEKYFQTQDFTSEIEQVITQFIFARLTQEYPQYFQYHTQNHYITFHNQLTQETLYLDPNFTLQSVRGLRADVPPYGSALDALANQVQEDINVVRRVGEKHWLSAIHVCFPNYWAVEANIGREFAQIHAPVAGMGGMNRRGSALVHTMITQPPMVRFAWGLSTDTRLNHHPEPPPGCDPQQWQGRNFNPNDPHLYIRMERQVIWGFPAMDAALFTIRTYFQDVGVLKQNPTQAALLQAAIQSMSPASLAYKGLDHQQPEILAWLGTKTAK